MEEEEDQQVDIYGLPSLPIEKQLGPYVIKLSHISKQYQLAGRGDEEAVVALHDVHMDEETRHLSHQKR